MTREAKIGMLTGLGVIVLIGVLLSEYLGDARSMTGAPPSGSASMAAAGATGRMAELPIGAGYRQQVMEPIGVPGMARGDAPLAAPGGTELAIGPMVVTTPPTAFAADGNAAKPEASAGGQASGPSVSAPVSPIAFSRAPMEQEHVSAGGPPTISVAEPVRPAPMGAVENTTASAGTTTVAPGAMVPTGTVPVSLSSAAPKAPVAGTSYVIAAGDNLAKIAKKFYQSSKNSDVKRIVAANPTMLKDAESPLIAGKTLTIPDAPRTAAAVAPVTASKAGPAAIPAVAAVPVRPGAVAAPARPVGAQPANPAALKKLLANTTEPVMIYLPGTLDGKAEPVTAGATLAGTTEVKKSVPAAVSKKDVAKDTKKDVAKETKKERSYEVQGGDTLEKIAKKYSPSNPTAFVAKLKAANGIKGEGLMKGQKLRIPG